jgi:hypothetical protein
MIAQRCLIAGIMLDQICRGKVARIVEVFIRYEYHAAIDAERLDSVRSPDIARQDALSLGVERNLENAQLFAVRPNLIVIIKHEPRRVDLHWTTRHWQIDGSTEDCRRKRSAVASMASVRGQQD